MALRDTHTDESVAEAIGLLKRALAIDPNYAPAKALIGWSRIHQGSHGRSPPSEAEQGEAAALAREALDNGKDDPDTLWMAGFTLMSYAGQRDVAAAAVDRALMLNPNSALAWAVRGYVSLGLDQTGPAIEALERAMRLSPLDSLRRAFTNGIASAHLRERRYEQALDWAELNLREEPDYRGALLHKTVASAHLGQMEKARATLRQWIESQPGITIARFSAFWSRGFSPEKMSICVEGLRKAGLPEG